MPRKLSPLLFVLIFAALSCGKSGRQHSEVMPPPENSIRIDLELIFDANNEGDVDVVLEAFNRLDAAAAPKDLPDLLNALKSPKNNFWTRELIAQPVARLGGVACLEELIAALSKGFAEGHDNDGLQTSLIMLAEQNPEKCRQKLVELMSRSDFKHRKHAEWLMEFIK
jgi:hypothetical protein